ncbi:DNA binding domain protein, excisionase family [Ammonifex degensii KC4]|uniref:DNA binding domain protein, excisionase family n=1 Tax=Ammonifex degensii (strain DSM 10501 / KC4) TaxID=429009 RepID=C9RCP2_AMMDK|nr:helix-turn-helix domain-containing protein [Ammonifex degensii]ACX52019.1 DNA binding domain protein, excisionase family [Ammonifex degensii KC4]
MLLPPQKRVYFVRLEVRALGELPEMLTVREVAKLLRIPVRSAFQHCKDGRIPCVRIGRTVRVPKKKLFEALGLREEDLRPS